MGGRAKKSMEICAIHASTSDYFAKNSLLFSFAARIPMSASKNTENKEVSTAELNLDDLNRER